MADITPPMPQKPKEEAVLRASSDSDPSDRPSNGIISRAPTHTSMNELAEDENLSRVLTARSQQQGTVGAVHHIGDKQVGPSMAMGAGRPFPLKPASNDEFLVEFDGVDDPIYPHNWPIEKKLRIAFILGYTTFICVFGSSIFAPGIPYVARQFAVSSEVGTLGMSLYVLGFAFGPIMWAPMSELYGRVLPIRIAIVGFTLFQFATATGKDIQTIMICRFFGGIFASCPLAVVAAVFFDMFDNRTRGLAITVFSLAVFTSPMMAPFIGGFIASSDLGWRWLEYITGIIGASAALLCLFFFQESNPSAILVNKAAVLRRETGIWAIHAVQEEVEIDLREIVSKNLLRPLRMLFTEPILLLISLYTAIVYGILYLFMTAYPMVFSKVHGMKPGVSGLPFFGLILGQALACLLTVVRQPSYMRKLQANNMKTIPEWRLPEVCAGAVAFAIGLFWFSWTGYKSSIHWIVPTLSGIFTGFGLMCIFLQSINYLVDTYTLFAASAMAANTLLRSLFGAAFPLFATQMFDGMGIEWAGTLLGCLAAVMIPVPVLFYFYGQRIRARSNFKPPGAPGPVKAPPQGEKAV